MKHKRNDSRRDSEYLCAPWGPSWAGRWSWRALGGVPARRAPSLGCCGACWTPACSHGPAALCVSQVFVARATRQVCSEAPMLDWVEIDGWMDGCVCGRVCVRACVSVDAWREAKNDRAREWGSDRGGEEVENERDADVRDGEV
eukprot:1261981-Rhodomonas_salina.1